jgi:hypothetical protein
MTPSAHPTYRFECLPQLPILKLAPGIEVAAEGAGEEDGVLRGFAWGCVGVCGMHVNA